MFGLTRNKPLNLKTAYKYVKRDLRRHFKQIDFEYKFPEDSLMVSARCSLDAFGEHDIIINVFKEGLVSFSVFFDKIPSTEDNLRFLNEYNADSLYFKAYVDEYLILEHKYKCHNVKDLKTYCSSMIRLFITSSDDENLLELLGRN